MNGYNNGAGYALDWDDEIQYIESNFVLLPAGEYPFTVTGFDRQNFDGSAKVPPCKMAVIHLAVDGGDLGTADVDERLYLHTSMLWKLSEFAVGIGQMEPVEGAAVRINWNAVPGSAGRVKLAVNKYTNKNGEERTNNRVEHFLHPERGRSSAPAHQTPARQQGSGQTQAAPAPQWQQPAQQQAMDGFQRKGRVAEQEKF